MAVTAENVTVLIQAARDGDAAARDRLYSLIYDELRHIAARLRRGAGRAGSLHPTLLANEAFLLLERRFPAPPRNQPESRATFFRSVALAMREILRDHCRRQKALKRGGFSPAVALHAQATITSAPPVSSDGAGAVDLLALSEAMANLERYNRRWFDVVSYRYFAARTIEETAELLGVGVTTVKSDWALARAWLHREIMGRERG
jgi:RNA polymerase sigma factor (TIGR02999 family)